MSVTGRCARPVAVGLLSLALLGCGAGTDGADPDPVPPSASAPAASLGHPLGSGSLDTEPFALREALFAEVRAAGGLTSRVSGPVEVTVEVVPAEAPSIVGARRFTWTEDDAELQQVQLPGGRVCVDRAAGEALQALGNAAVGQVVPGNRPWSCTAPGDPLGAFVVHGMSGRDPLARLAGLLGSPVLTDLGVETTGDGAGARHLRIAATEGTPAGREVATTYDLWVDDDLRLVRAEWTGLEEEASLSATFAYGPVAPVRLPPAAERGPLALRSGLGPGPAR